MQATTNKRETLTITQLNRQAKRLLEGHFQSVWVTGEISNLAKPSSGHWYFSLKDNGAQVRCAMFRSSNARLRFRADAGQQVIARAKLSLYEARGDYQLIVEHMEPAGAGALALAFEELKAKLQSQGYFDPALKKTPPSLPRHVAIVTSATGAAIRDMLTVFARRFPGTAITLLPVAVQGNNAAPEIARAIKMANHLSADNGFDVILVGRGGGSLEDLWSFNEEIVAQAIFHSELPVVSAVGHEVDFTIADFVADIRAATPSAGAELLSPDWQEMYASFLGMEQLLTQSISAKINDLKKQLDWRRSNLRHPGSRLQEHAQRLDELEMRLGNAWKNQARQRQLGINVIEARLQQQTPSHLIKQLQQRSQNNFKQLLQHLNQRLENHRQRLKNAAHVLDAVSPLATLERGYSIATTEDKNIITDSNTLQPGQTIYTKLANGNVESKVTKLFNDKAG